MKLNPCTEVTTYHTGTRPINEQRKNKLDVPMQGKKIQHAKYLLNIINKIVVKLLLFNLHRTKVTFAVTQVKV
jgi:hypothetical protein